MVGRACRRARLALAVVAAYFRVRGRLAQTKDVRALVALARGSRRSMLPRSVAASPAEVWRLSRAVQWTLQRFPTRSPCLVQSLVLLELLARRGTRATLVIGAVAADGFEAHAWVEVDGCAVLPPGGFGSHRLAEV